MQQVPQPMQMPAMQQPSYNQTYMPAPLTPQQDLANQFLPDMGNSYYQQQLAKQLSPQIGYANQNYQQPAFNPFGQQGANPYNPYGSMYDLYSNPYFPPTGQPQPQQPQEGQQQQPFNFQQYNPYLV